MNIVKISAIAKYVAQWLMGITVDKLGGWLCAGSNRE